jgi:nucleoside phosphorylase
LVWEAGPDARDGRIERRLAVVAAEDSERLVDHLLWTRGDGAPTPLTRHLMHAARLRHQTRVFDLGKVPRQVRDELDLLTGGLSAGLDSGQDFVGQDWLATRLWHTYMAAGRLRTRLDAMRQAVSVISENMRLALTLPATDASVGPLSEDRQLAAWFGQRLDDEIARLDGAVLPPPVSSLLDGEASRPARERGRAEFDGRAARGLRPAQPRQLPGPCVVVFTALEVEYNAIRDYLGRQITELKQRGTLYEIGSLPEVRGSWRVVLTQTGAGSVAAGVQLDRAIPLFEPDVAIFLGVAGGRKSVIRGDVVVADAIYDYEGGKSTREGYLPRMRTQYPAYHLVQLAKRITRQKRWQQRIRPRCPAPPPSSFVRPIVTGAKVVAHDRSAIARLIDQYASDALAIEMEGHGFLESAHMNPGVSALVIRGISDLLAGKDEANDGYWQPAASSHAAAFALELLDSLGMDQAVSLPPPVPRG